MAKLLFTQKPKIVIIEDSKEASLAIQKGLKHRDYEVIGVLNQSDDIIYCIENATPDIILMDIALENKYSAIDIVTSTAHKYSIPIVYVISSSLGAESLKKTTAPYGHIRVPFDIIDLEVSIQTALYKKQLQQSLKSPQYNSTAGEASIAAPKNVCQNNQENRASEEQTTYEESCYQDFMSHHHESIWKMEFEEKLPISSPTDEMAYHIIYNGRVTEVDKAITKISSRIDIEDLKGKNLAEIYKANTEDEIDTLLKKVKLFIENNLTTWDEVITEKNKNGVSTHTISSTSGHVENGRLVKLWGIQRDITTSINTLSALKQNEFNLTRVQRLAKIGSWYLDTANNKMKWSDQTFHFFGYQPDEIRPDLDLFMHHIHGDDHAKVADAFDQSISQQIDHSIEFRIIDTQNSLKILQNKSEYIVDGNGQTIGLRGVIQDITEQRKAQEKLIQSEQRFRDVVSISSDLVWEVDTTGKYTYCSDRVEGLLGYTIDEIMDMTPFDIMPEEEAKHKQAYFHDHISNPHTVKNQENWYIKKNGQLVCLLSSMVTIVDSDGNPKGMRGIDRNITEAKMAEVAMRSDYDKLEQRINKRTKDLKNSNEELKELAYTLSHDLKAPLRGIKTLIEWVREDNKSNVDNASLKNFQMIEQKVALLYRLIDGITEFSKVSNSRYSEEVNLEVVIKEVVEMLNIPESVNLVVSDHLPTITSSKIQMIQVFQNLISNAIKYSEKDNVKIEVGVESENSEWKFFVKDNGKGIESRHFDRIFKIFKTLAPKNDQHSTGIGLSIVKKIINKQNGKIWVESEIGKGSCFYFTLKQR